MTVSGRTVRADHLAPVRQLARSLHEEAGRAYELIPLRLLGVEVHGQLLALDGTQLGYLIHQMELNFDTTGVLSGILILMIFVLAIDALVTLVEKRLLVWRPEAGRVMG